MQCDITSSYSLRYKRSFPSVVVFSVCGSVLFQVWSGTVCNACLFSSAKKSQSYINCFWSVVVFNQHLLNSLNVFHFMFFLTVTQRLVGHSCLARYFTLNLQLICILFLLVSLTLFLVFLLKSSSGRRVAPDHMLKANYPDSMMAAANSNSSGLKPPGTLNGPLGSV